MLDLHVKENPINVLPKIENPINAYIDELCELSLTLQFTILLNLLDGYS